VDDELRPVLGPPIEPPADVWAATVSGAVDDRRSGAELAALVPGFGYAPDGSAAAAEAGEEPHGPADAGQHGENDASWDTDAMYDQSVDHRPEIPDADDPGWIG
jgi:hypothetical protein